MIHLLAALAVVQIPPGVEIVDYRPPTFVYEQDVYLFRTPVGTPDQVYLPFPVASPGPITIEFKGSVVVHKPDHKGPVSPLMQPVKLLLRDANEKVPIDATFSRGEYKRSYLPMTNFSKWHEPADPPGPQPAPTPFWKVWRLELHATPGPSAVRGKLRVTFPAYGYPYTQEVFDSKPTFWKGVTLLENYRAGKAGYYEAAAQYFLQKPGIPIKAPVPGTITLKLGPNGATSKTKTGAGWNILMFRVNEKAAAAPVRYDIRAEPVQPVDGYSGRFTLKRYPLAAEKFTLDGHRIGL